MKHEAFIVPGSTKKSAVGGVEFVVRCCGTHEKSVHIQHPGRYSQEELLRIRDQHLEEVAQEHALGLSMRQSVLSYLLQDRQEYAGLMKIPQRRPLLLRLYIDPKCFKSD